MLLSEHKEEDHQYDDLNATYQIEVVRQASPIVHDAIHRHCYEINEKRNEILEKIALEEKRLLDTEVTELDVTAWSNVNEPMPEFYPATPAPL